jgi:hypothetical protein
MITESIIQYTVSDPTTGFNVTVDDKSKAEQIEQTLQITKEIINTISKYDSKNDESVSLSFEVRPKDSIWEFTNEGKLTGFKTFWTNIQIDNWDGRPAIHSSGTDYCTGDDFKEKIIKVILRQIDLSLDSMEYASSRSVEDLWHLPKKVLNIIKIEIEEKKHDKEILNKYLDESDSNS